MLIEDEQGARRLARAIMADVTLYNSERLAHAMDPERDLASELAEGRQLFQSRVAPTHHAIFEDVVRAWAIDARARATSAAIAPKEEPAPPREDRAREEELRREEAIAAIKRQRIILFVVMILMTCAITYFFFTSSRHRHGAPAQETQDKHEGARH